ncbi:hypothetical protein SOTOND1_00937 [Chlamydia trachomatis D/SotonD1]|nr:hypothetical protein DU13_0942 [Chlamydia trachomatis]CCP53074.1 hypothetical protein SOTOND1_00937 [Chlamydia trachomatis D/SotonD1]CCP57564.1 hypothetical protein SOTONF3_00935 [Chlamydia trachomatis F/SotonF3]CCP61140.1 hypothetical protein BOUR_00939 [Chlamydia trachomatis E/Bour]ROT51167.1 hypothetical protein DU15_0943 [Chlamydia trachomatis]
MRYIVQEYLGKRSYEGETFSPGDREQLEATLESAAVKFAGLMLDYWDGDSLLECKKI